MSSLLMWTPAVAVPFALAVWLLMSQRSRTLAHGELSDEDIEKLRPAHYRYFPQIRQALAACDEDYLRQNTSPDVVKRALRERRMVTRKFLGGLLEDFSNLERMGRTVAALSPEISREQEFERLMLGMKFRLLYAAISIRLSVGRVPLQNLEHLAGLVGKMSGRMDQAIASIAALSQPGLTDHFTA